MASNINNNLRQLLLIADNILDESESNRQIPRAFQYLEEKTGVNRKLIWWSLVACVTVWLAMGYSGQLISNLIGIFYPAYASICALESRSTEDDVKWLTYWIVYSIFSVVECFTSILLGWFPLYWLAKVTFLVWLMIPTNFNGALILYQSVIKPYFVEYHGVIDETVSEIESKVTDFIEKTKYN